MWNKVFGYMSKQDVNISNIQISHHSLIFIGSKISIIYQIYSTPIHKEYKSFQYNISNLDVDNNGSGDDNNNDTDTIWREKMSWLYQIDKTKSGMVVKNPSIQSEKVTTTMWNGVRSI